MKKLLIIAAIALLVAPVVAQQKRVLDNVIISRSKALKVGKTDPVSTLVKRASTDRTKKATRKNIVMAAPENFFGRNGSHAKRPELEHQGSDPIRQFSIPTSRAASKTPMVNRDGLSSAFGSPNDPTGDVGLNYYVQAINATEIAVFDKVDGSLVDEFAANTLWAPIGESSAGDPIVLFDHEASRWIITEFTSPNGSASLLFAISDSSDPLGSYSVYAFTPPNFPDYPKWAIWKDYYMVTTNEAGPGSLHQYFFDRSAFLQGASEVTMQRVEITGNGNTEAGFYVSTPVSWVGDTLPADSSPIAIKINDSSWGEVASDVIEVFTFNVDLENTTSVSKTTIEVTPFDGYPCDAETGGFACLSQGGSATGIDAIPEVVMNLPHYRNFGTHESIVLSFITDVTDGDNLSGIRWMELRRTTGDWELYQEGTFAPDDGLHRFMPSISMDRDGNIALAYNTTGPNDFVSVKYTGRYAEDPLGVMTLAEYDVVNGSGSIEGVRFGDYAQMAIDPVNERTFWYTTEYGSDQGTKTRIVSFKLENVNDIAVESIDEPSTGSGFTSNENVVATVRNLGENAVSNFDIVLKKGENVIETFNFTGTLPSKETYQHTFSSTIDMSNLGVYDISVEVSLTGDEDVGNDTLKKEVLHLVPNDVSIFGDLPTNVCNENVELLLDIKNEGGETLTSTDIQVFVNEVLAKTLNWTGSLGIGEQVQESILLSGLEPGTINIAVEATNPNGQTDPNTTDNSLSFVINTEGIGVSFKIFTDQYPDETTWEVTDESGNVVISGGPYSEGFSLLEEDLCLDQNGCYTLTVFDAYADGICCEYGEGSFAITLAEDTIFVSDGIFQDSISAEFCLGAGGCMLAVSVETENENVDDLGIILVSAIGSYDYQYSIDGGITFQDSSSFRVEAGTYTLQVVSQGGHCLYEEEVSVGFDCALFFDIEQEKNTNNTGNIIILPQGGNEYEYSIDGGATFQDSNEFLNVPSGEYTIQVRSFGGKCIAEALVLFDFVLGTYLDKEISIAPNPTNGVFKISVSENVGATGFLHVEVLDMNGRILQNHRFSKYDGSFEGTISLFAYPNGMYFLRLKGIDSPRLVKVIKQ